MTLLTIGVASSALFDLTESPPIANTRRSASTDRCQLDPRYRSSDGSSVSTTCWPMRWM